MEDNESLSLSHLVCVGCKDSLDFNNSMQLARCLHILCSQCMDLLERQRSFITCPHCQGENSIPDNKEIRAQGGHTSPFRCSVCNEDDCNHTQLLVDLTSDAVVSSNGNGYCSVSTHVNDVDEQPCPLNYFCVDHWRPVCEKCVSYGDHGLCTRNDLQTFIPTLNRLIELNKKQLTIYVKDCEMEIMTIETNKEKAKRHNDATIDEIDDQKEKILRHFRNLATTAQQKGDKMIQTYTDKLKRLEERNLFLTSLLSPLDRLKMNAMTVVRSELPIVFAKAFNNMERVKKLLDDDLTLPSLEIDQMKSFKLILPDVTEQGAIPPSVSDINIICEKQTLVLKYTIITDPSHTTDSLLVIGPGKCIISEHDSGSARISRLKLNRNGQLNIKEIYLQCDSTHSNSNKKYTLARSKSGEILICRHQTKNRKDVYDIAYLKMTHIDEWRVDKNKIIYQNELPITCLAVSPDNNIFVCVINKQNKKTKQVGVGANSATLTALSLQGRPLDSLSSFSKEDCYLASPKQIAFSQWGEIAISDPLHHSILILERDHNTVDKIEYFLPTTVKNPQITDGMNETYFRPEGLCYDRLGRIIVADSKNHCILRISRNADGVYKMKPLRVQIPEKLKKRFFEPHLVVLASEDDVTVLWVVCKGYIFVFDYEDL